MNPFTERLRESCARHAARVAILERGRAFTYSQLEARIERVAARLREAGVGVGSLVVLEGGRGFARIADLAALFRVGSSALLSCPRWPEPYLRDCTQQSGADWRLDAGELRRAHVGGAASTGAPRRQLGGACPPLPEDLAYVVYTSGSSGRPKGVLVPHAGLVAVLDAQIAAFGLHPGSRSLFVLGLGFDASLSDIGTALLAGAALVIEDDAACAPGRIQDTLARTRVTYADLPPAYLSWLDERRLPDALETLVVGGEVPPEPDVRRIASRLALFNVYGPSEATICTSLVRCDASWSRPLLGQPVASNHYALRDPVPCGPAESEGELVITGPGVAHGYLGDDAQTAQRFIRDGGSRAFRTGDRVRARADREWEFLGRIDRQVKRRGQLVAPEHVEAALLRTGLLRAAHVALDPLRDRLVAHVEARASLDPQAAGTLAQRLREELLETLPPALVPDQLEVVAQLERNASGKVAHGRAGQGRAAQAHTAREVTHDGPDVGTVALLAGLMGDVLRRPALEADEDFYELGGDSLTALELVARAEAAGWGLDLAALVRGRTPRETVARLGDRTPSYAAQPELEDAVGVTPRVAAVAPRARPLEAEELLLTGASGTLGLRVLRELLERVGPQGRVHCLVRRPDALVSVAADERAVAQDPRVVAHVGDLRAEQLGIAANVYAALAEHVHSVVHLGAELSAAAPATALREVNVEGTRRVLGFVAAGRAKALLYASTLSVLCEASPRPACCQEDDALDATESLGTPYAASKWVAERLVRRADPEAEATTIVRLGLLTGDARTGRGAHTGHLARFVRGVTALGALPMDGTGREAASLAFDVTPLDDAASASVDLFVHDRARGAGCVYHVAARQPATLALLVAALRAEGVALGVCSWAELCARAGALRDPSGDATLALLSLCRADEAAYARHRALDLFAATGTHFSLVNSHRALAQTRRAAPAPDLALLRLYVRSALA